MFEKAGSSYEKESFPKGVYPVVVEDVEPYEFTNSAGEATQRIGWKLRIREGHKMAGKLMETSGPRYLTPRNRSGKIIEAILGEIPADPTDLNVEKQIKGQKIHVQWDHGNYNGTPYEGLEAAFKLPQDEENGAGNPPPVPAGNVENDTEIDDLNMEVPF